MMRNKILLSDDLYIASPYTHTEAQVQEHRYKLVCVYAAQVFADHPTVNLYCPVAQFAGSAGIASHLPEALLHDHDWWMRLAHNRLICATALVLVPIRGWRESKGVQMELQWAKQFLMPIFVMTCQNHGDDEIDLPSDGLMRDNDWNWYE